MKVKKSVKRGFLIFLVILFVISLAFLGYYGYEMYMGIRSKPTEVKIIDKIEAYNYYLEEDAPEGYKTMFKELAKVLKEKEIDEKEYASLISSMFVLDFYTLNNKVSKNDIGGVQFIHSKYKDNFILEAGDTVYKYIELNLDGKRKQKLPEVTSVEVIDSETRAYNYEGIKDNSSYIIKLKLSYKEDLGYPSEVTVKLVHTDKKLEIIYLK